jgi:hypothetical protein
MYLINKSILVCAFSGAPERKSKQELKDFDDWNGYTLFNKIRAQIGLITNN